MVGNTVQIQYLIQQLFLINLIISQCNKNYYIWQIKNNQQMDKAKKLNNEPYMIEIKKIVKPIYISQIQEAIEQQNQEIIQKLLYKYLRKKQAEQYCPKVLFGLRKYKRQRNKNNASIHQNWDLLRIVKYLQQRLEPEQVLYIVQLIDQKNQDLCNTLLKDLLRFQEAEEVIPQVRSFIRKQNNNQQPIQQTKSNSSNINREWSNKYQQQIIQYIKVKLTPQKSQLIQTWLKQLKVAEADKILKQELSDKQYQFIITKIRDNFTNRTPNPIHNSTKPIEKTKQNPEKTENQVRKFQQMVILQMQTKVQNNKKIYKQNLLKDIQAQLGEQQSKNYQQIKKLLNKGKLKKIQQILKPILGKKCTQNWMKKIRQKYQQKISTPLENALYLKQKQDGLRFFQLQTQQILDLPQDEIMNVLIVGMTGVGKSTFLNAFVNYYLQVDMEDDFRYVVSNDMFNNGTGKSSTTKVNIYGMPKQGKMKKATRLIDIPGLGDTGGIKKDREHIEMIRDRIAKTVPFINLIIYVFKSSETRITKETEYVMGQIMGMFAKDLTTNILFVLTFADNEQPSIVKPLRSTFSSIIDKIEEKNKCWFVKVNNSALFKKINIEDKVDVTFYSMGQACLQKTADIIDSSSKISTRLTISVMNKRNQLETAIQGLHELISSSLVKQQQIRKITELISNSKAAMEGLEYKIKFKQQKVQLIDTDKIVTSCMNCKFTCHKNCSRSNQQKNKCVAMEKGKCKVCPNKCSWEAHINDNKIVKRVFVEVQKTNKQLQQKYNVQKQTKNKNEQLLLGLVSDYGMIMITAKNFCEQLKELNQELSKIELRKINHATVVQYIQILIQNELNDKLQGYMGRIKEYQVIKQYEQRLNSTFKQTEVQQAKKFHQLMQNRIQDLIPNKDIAKNLLKTVMDNYQQIKIAQKDIQMIKEQEMISPQEQQPQQK